MSVLVVKVYFDIIFFVRYYVSLDGNYNTMDNIYYKNIATKYLNCNFLCFSNMGATVLFGSVSLISSVLLETGDADTDPDQLYYVVLTIPEKGYLQLKQGNLPGVR